MNEAPFAFTRVQQNDAAARIMLNQPDAQNPLGPHSGAECRHALREFE